MKTLMYVGVAAWVLMGCVTTAPNQQPPPKLQSTEVELVVNDVDDETLKDLLKGFLEVPELRSARVKTHVNRVATITILYPGPVSDLPKSISEVPHPGLRYGKSTHSYEYSAFDNVPPTITILHPPPNLTLNKKEQYVTVDVPDKDVASVTIAGKPAPLYKGTVYRLKVNFVEGPQELIATAKDKAGNESVAKVSVNVDTTAPALQAQLKLVVEGTVETGSSVLIDGVEVPVDFNGHYKAEVPVRKGQKKVEIVAIDPSGNKTVTTRTIGE